jgi:type II secretory pathway component PulC
MIEFLISINKISLIIFFITLGVLVYEYRLLKKEKKREKQPKIPQFNDTFASSFQKSEKVMVFEEKQEKFTRHSSKLFILLIVVTLFFAVITLIGFFSKEGSEVSRPQNPQPTSIVEEKIVTSDGIEIFDENFNSIKENELSELSPEKKLIFGIKTITGADIDKARIRVNKNFWEIGDETNKFNEKNQVFYIEYQLATDEVKIKIEAQLHSANEGWLGE